MLSDLAFALRQARKAPGFTLVVVLTLALGIGANSAIFSIVDAVLLAPLPYPHSDRLVALCEMPQGKYYLGFTSGGVFADWQDESTQLQYIAAMHPMDENLSGAGTPVRLSGAEVSADYLKVFGIKPMLGRDFLPAEDAAGGNHAVALVSYELWQTHLAADPAIVGRQVRLDDRSLTVIGVLPPHAFFGDPLSFLVPAAIRESEHHMNRDYNYVVAVTGRLKAGATMAQASEELKLARRGIAKLYPVFKQPWSVGAEPLREMIFGNMRSEALMLFCAVGIVLLIACANVANLFLARGTVRRGEMAVRLALGATPGRIVRQLLTESLAFALVAGAVGLGIGVAALRPLVAYTGIADLVGTSLGINPPVLLFTLAASCATGLLFGVLPARSAVRSTVAGDLKNGARGTTVGNRRLQSTLLISETALTVVLLACAGLLLRSFRKALTADPGFDPRGVLVFDVSVSNAKAPTTAERVRFDRLLIDRLRQLPGVSHVAIASGVPMNGDNGLGDMISREDRPLTRNDANAGFDSVAGDYFPALHIPLLRGRYLTAQDDPENAPKVIIVNDAFARKFFGRENPLGHQLHFKDAVWEIVGVVGNVRRYELDYGPVPEVYFSPTYFPWRTTVIIRTAGPTGPVAAVLQAAVHDVDPDLPIANLHTLQSAVDETLRVRRTMLVLLGVFGAVALGLACIGIYGVISYASAQRTREIGIRIALGANGRQIIALILKESSGLVAIGVGLGLAASIGVGSLIASELYEVSRTDPAVLVSVAAVLMGVGIIASCVPALRASRINPSQALRGD